MIQQIVAGSNRLVNEANPIVDARLPDGSRVNVVLAPVALNGPIVTIRKFPREAITMKDLLAWQSVSPEVVGFLAAWCGQDTTSSSAGAPGREDHIFKRPFPVYPQG